MATIYVVANTGQLHEQHDSGWLVPGPAQAWAAALLERQRLDRAHSAPLQHPEHNLASATQAGVVSHASLSSTAASRKNWFIRHPILTGVAGLCLIAVIAGAVGSAGGEGDEGDNAVASDTDSGGAHESTAARPHSLRIPSRRLNQPPSILTVTA